MYGRLRITPITYYILSARSNPDRRFLGKIKKVNLNSETKNLLPQWFKEDTPKELILSNDIDSLLSVRLLEKIKPNWKLKYFYDFESGLYYLGDETGKKINAVGVDIAIDKNIRTFDNHVTSDNNDGINPNAVNLNNVYGIGANNYSRKYCCSTALLIYSLYDIPLPPTDLGKALLLAIDSTYYSYYNPIARNRPDWLEIHKHWLCDILELHELYEFEKKSIIEDFNQYAFINEAKIQVIDDWGNGKFQMYFPLDYKHIVEKELDICLDVPDEYFKLGLEVKAKSGKLNGLHKTDIMNRFNIMSFAMTAKNYCNFSVYEKRKK